ncbi:nucleotide exchange factor GrpE [Nocardia sp. NPDC052566]|uniref:nucleotide exchange factor GrpE n=1 Tax=Nocardia sp. NPDC052566 TaxID=3364330 RepID=UPI0037CA5591
MSEGQRVNQGPRVVGPGESAGRPGDSMAGPGEASVGNGGGSATGAGDAGRGIEQLAERVEDLTRVIARQAATIERLADEAKATARQAKAGADLPLVVELFALYSDTVACAKTAESAREREAFTAVTARVERLITGRGGTIVTPSPNTPFDSLTMEAAEVTSTPDPAADRTIAETLQPGLTVAGRSVRPARVVVRRHRPS